tara:strand:+ start:69 stop:245 length:177 start_codon:yes stop_codon:yes gene_type:complete
MDYLIVLDKLEALRLRQWMADQYIEDKKRKKVHLGIMHQVQIIDNLEDAKKFLRNKYE